MSDIAGWLVLVAVVALHVQSFIWLKKFDRWLGRKLDKWIP